MITLSTCNSMKTRELLVTDILNISLCKEIKVIYMLIINLQNYSTGDRYYKDNYEMNTIRFL